MCGSSLARATDSKRPFATGGSGYLALSVWRGTCFNGRAEAHMSENKGKPSKQQADERKEREVNDDPASPRKIHRLDRSRSDEKGGKGATPKTAATAKRASVAARSSRR
jgi:hypothetical protein